MEVTALTKAEARMRHCFELLETVYEHMLGNESCGGRKVWFTRSDPPGSLLIPNRVRIRTRARRVKRSELRTLGVIEWISDESAGWTGMRSH